MSFEKTPLNEFITLQRGFDLPKGDRVEGAVPVIASTGVGGYHNTAKVDAPGVVIGRSGSIGGGQYIQEPFWPLNTTLWVKDFKGHDPRYIYYLMRSIDFTKFNVGSGVPTLNRNHLSSLLVNELGIDREKAISKQLGDLDDKIALNTQTNQTLEQMAQAIFKSWFVDFDPVQAKMNGEQPEGMDAATASLFPDKLVESELGLIPDGWDAGTLSDVANYCSARTSIDSICLDNYISTENMLADRKGVTAASKLPTAKMVAAYKTGDVLVSNIRPYFKKIWLAEGNGGRSNDVLGFESSAPNTDAYIMNLLYQDTFFEYMTRTSKGAKMPRGDKTAIMNWGIAVPPVELREAYSAIVDKFYKLIPQNRAQNETLESLRDTLLPKLLSGEIELEPAGVNAND